MLIEDVGFLGILKSSISTDMKLSILKFVDDLPFEFKEILCFFVYCIRQVKHHIWDKVGSLSLPNLEFLPAISVMHLSFSR